MQNSNENINLNPSRQGQLMKNTRWHVYRAISDYNPKTERLSEEILRNAYPRFGFKAAPG